MSAASRNRVAYIITPITFGGSERVSLNFLQTVDRNYFEIRLVLLIRPWEKEPYLARELRLLGYAYDMVPVALKPGGDFLRVARVAYRLYSILKKGSFDLVHTHGYFADICGLPAARALGVRSIATCHGFIGNDRKLRVYNMMDKYVLRLCKTVITVSEDIKQELVRSGISTSRIVVIPNAVSRPCGYHELNSRRLEKRRSLLIAAHEYVVGYVGRLSEEKGLRYLIEAVAILREEAVPVKLLIVGDGPERSTLEQLVRARGLERASIFTGFQTDIDNWLPAFDFFSLPSLTEGTPMALLEAMAMGLPVIASAVGGVPKVITDGFNGLLTLPADPQAISDRIKLLKDNPELKSRLGRAASETVNTKYDINSWCRKIERRYLEKADH